MNAATQRRLGSALTSEEDETEAKRRRLRKGTRSCWECKRRKVRCIFKSDGEATCEPCLRRGSSCVSQEFPEETSAASHGESGRLRERLGRVEDLLSNLVDEVRGKLPQDVGAPSLDGRVSGFAPTPISEPESNQFRSLCDTSPTRFSPGDTNPSTARELPSSSSSVLTFQESTSASTSAENYQLSQALLAAFPSQTDMEILCKIDYETTIYFYQVNTKSQKELENDGIDLARRIGRLSEAPCPDTHPVLLAKRMLLFALFMQSHPYQGVENLFEQPRVIMKRFAETAINLLHNNEELLGAAESLECIILEAVYQANSGNLRRAWLAFRRAMMVAQMMNIHRPSSPPPKALNPSLKINSQLIWFRIVYMDRLLSLMLGLPQGTPDRSMVSKHALDNDTPTGQLQRIHAMIAARIIERNERNQLAEDFTETQDIDAELLKTARSMPDRFWLPPKFDGPENNQIKLFWETMRLVDQIFHYSLVSLLHLPHSYSAPGSNVERKYEYSKIACANANREILTRFVTFRSFKHVASCCRPVDFFALMAAMLLLITHLNSHRQPSANNFLAHQRLGDRAIVEQVLKNMKTVAKLNEDAMMEKSAGLLRRILDIEAEAAQGFNSSRESGQPNDDNVLRYSIPYLGVISISPDGVGCTDIPGTQTQKSGECHAMNNTGSICHPAPVHMAGGVPPLPKQPNLDALPLLSFEQQAQLLPEKQIPEITVVQPSFSYSAHDMTQTNLYPNLAAGIDEWVFQGVDTAFFNSIMNGTGFLADDGDQNSNWTPNWDTNLNEL